MRTRLLALAAGLALVSPAAAQDAAQPVADTPANASVEALVAGGMACATRKLSKEKMAERLAAAGWTPGASLERTRGMLLQSYARQDVTLFYFTSSEMTQCIAHGMVPADYDSRPLLAALTAQLGKQPKVDEPGKRYLYFLPRLDILTVQIKSDERGPHVELSVVH